MAEIFADASQLEEIASYVFLGADTDGSGYRVNDKYAK